MKTKTNFLKITFALILGLILLSKDIFGQSNYKIFVAISPLSVIDYKDGSSFRPSIEFRAKNSYSFAFESGIYLNSFSNFFSYKANVNGFLFKPTLKYYFKPHKNKSSSYIGVEYQFKSQKYDLNDSIKINGVIFQKDYFLKRRVNCLSVKYGQVKLIKKKFLMEWFAGIGIRFLSSSSSLTNVEYEGILRGEKYYNNTGGGYTARIIGDKILPNFVLGLKFGYKIK